MTRDYEPGRDYAAEMKLPEGKTCADCRHFERTCRWLISYKGHETSCDWHPSKFSEKEKAS